METRTWVARKRSRKSVVFPLPWSPQSTTASIRGIMHQVSEETPTLREAIDAMRIHAPSERNPRLAAFLAAANDDVSLKARWHVAQVNADRLDMSDHSWVHLQIVLNRALHL